MPDWFEIIEAARWMHIPPWELSKQPIYWTRAIMMHKAAMEPFERQQQKVH